MALNSYNLNDDQFDALREIGNIGSGHAASALSELIGRPVDITVPKVNILDYGQAAENLGGPENVLAGILLQLDGDVSGMIMFLVQKDFASLLLNNLLGTPLGDKYELDEMGQSAIMEVGNIIAASYVNAIASLTGLTINVSVPELCIDMVGALLSMPAIYYADISDKIIFIEDSLDQTNTAQSQIMLIPDNDSLKKIMQSLGMDS